MADIARESGDSLSTVSMVLADKPGLPPETRQLVLSVLHASGYHNRAEVPEAMPVTAMLRPLLVERSSMWDLKPENLILTNVSSPLQR